MEAAASALDVPVHRRYRMINVLRVLFYNRYNIVVVENVQSCVSGMFLAERIVIIEEVKSSETEEGRIQILFISKVASLLLNRVWLPNHL